MRHWADVSCTAAFATALTHIVAQVRTSVGHVGAGHAERVAGASHRVRALRSGFASIDGRQLDALSDDLVRATRVLRAMMADGDSPAPRG